MAFLKFMNDHELALPLPAFPAGWCKWKGVVYTYYYSTGRDLPQKLAWLRYLPHKIVWRLQAHKCARRVVQKRYVGT